MTCTATPCVLHPVNVSMLTSLKTSLGLGQESVNLYKWLNLECWGPTGAANSLSRKHAGIMSSITQITHTDTQTHKQRDSTCRSIEMANCQGICQIYDCFHRKTFSHEEAHIMRNSGFLNHYLLTLHTLFLNVNAVNVEYYRLWRFWTV